jgi:hypothetical protein
VTLECFTPPLRVVSKKKIALAQDEKKKRTRMSEEESNGQIDTKRPKRENGKVTENSKKRGAAPTVTLPVSVVADSLSLLKEQHDEQTQMLKELPEKIQEKIDPCAPPKENSVETCMKSFIRCLASYNKDSREAEVTRALQQLSYEDKITLAEFIHSVIETMRTNPEKTETVSNTQSNQTAQMTAHESN